jgi:hypothetical protein
MAGVSIFTCIIQLTASMANTSINLSQIAQAIYQQVTPNELAGITAHHVHDRTNTMSLIE